MNYQLLEVANGILAVMYTWMFLYGALHIGRCYRSAREHLVGRPTTWRAVRHLYFNNKPEIALMFIVGSLTLRTWLLWYLRYMDNRNFDGWMMVRDVGTELVVILTLMVTIGVSCWIRVITPYRQRNGLIWFLMVVVAVAFGFGSALSH